MPAARSPQSQFLMAAMLLPAVFLVACDTQETPLQWQDLTATEQNYVQRLVILERAKAVALNDRDLGDAVLDSLATAWGDSATANARALAPTDPARSRLLYTYLLRVLEAEKDSLMAAPEVRRLAAPLPRPLAEALEDQPDG